MAKPVDVSLKSLHINPYHFYRSLTGVKSLREPSCLGAKEFNTSAQLNLNLVIVTDVQVVQLPDNLLAGKEHFDVLLSQISFAAMPGFIM